MDTATDQAKLKQRLDQVTLDFFDTLEQLYQSQAKLEAVMRDGFLSMSRARYSMGGTRNVGALQFPENEVEMEALSVVDVEEDSIQDSGKDEYSRTGLEFKLFEKQVGTTTKIDSKSDTKTDDLRQRRGHGKDQAETIGMTQMSSDPKANTAEPRAARPLKNPLTLFGVLVSPHLRQCQAAFKQAVALAVDIANLKHTLQGHQRQFELLTAQKKAVES